MHADASFTGEKLLNASEATSVLSRTSFIIKYVGCPMFWSSKLHTEIYLIPTEAKHIELSRSMRETLILVQLLKEVYGTLKIE